MNRVALLGVVLVLCSGSARSTLAQVNGLNAGTESVIPGFPSSTPLDKPGWMLAITPTAGVLWLREDPSVMGESAGEFQIQTSADSATLVGIGAGIMDRWGAVIALEGSWLHGFSSYDVRPDPASSVVMGARSGDISLDLVSFGGRLSPGLGIRPTMTAGIGLLRADVEGIEIDSFVIPGETATDFQVDLGFGLELMLSDGWYPSQIRVEFRDHIHFCGGAQEMLAISICPPDETLHQFALSGAAQFWFFR